MNKPAPIALWHRWKYRPRLPERDRFWFGMQFAMTVIFMGLVVAVGAI